MRFHRDRLSRLFYGFAARVLIVTAMGVVSVPPSSRAAVSNAQPSLKKLFHLVGIPGLERDSRVDLSMTVDALLFETKKVEYRVPYARIQQILMLSADRRYEGRTYAAAVATYGVGALFILKKHHVDTVVLDYVNERGGKMGIVLQMETAQGELLRKMLKERGVLVTEPEAVPEAKPDEGKQGETKPGSKQ